MSELIQIILRKPQPIKVIVKTGLPGVPGGGGGGGEVTKAELEAEAAARISGDNARLQRASNLSDVTSAVTSRTNLGLGSAATHATGDFDAAGAAGTAQSAAETAATTKANASEAGAISNAAAKVKTEEEARKAEAKTEREAREAADTSESSTRASTDTTIKGEVKIEKEAREAADNSERARAENKEVEAVKLTGTQTIAGVKTFSSPPSVPTPVGASDAVTKEYADAIAAGVSPKESAVLATAAALPANSYAAGVITGTTNGALTIDTVAVTTGMHVLIKNEATEANNGLYTVTKAGGAAEKFVLTRSKEMETGAQVPGSFTFIEAGEKNESAGFTVVGKGPFTIGTTAIKWTQFSGAGEISAGTGITKSGNTLSVTANTYEPFGTALAKASNLSDLNSAATARTNLGLGSAATSNTSAFATPAEVTTEKEARETADGLRPLKSNNLSDLASASTARTNLGLGTAATQNSTAFATPAEVTTEKSAREAADAEKLAKASNLSDVASAATSRTNLGLGTAATHNTGDFATPTEVTTEKTAREAGDAESVKLTGTQTVAGVKTFSSNPSVPTPVAAGDAANKEYVDGVAAGLSPKESVTAATATALPTNTYSAGVLTASANGALTVDGIAVSAGQRVLVKNEAEALKNGIYKVTAAGGAAEKYILTRSKEMEKGTQVPGAFVFVEEGTEPNKSGGFTVVGAGPFTIGTTEIKWTQFSGAGEITAGTGLTKNGNTLSVTSSTYEPFGVALAKASNLSDLASASTARTNLGLGSAATQNSTAFATPTEVTTEKESRETADGLRLLKSNNLSDVASAATSRTNLGLGTASTHPATDFATPAEANAKRKPTTFHAWVWKRGEEVAAETVDGHVIRPASGEEILAVAVDYKVAAGEVTFKLQRTNAAGETSDLTGFTGLVAKTTPAKKEPTAVVLAAGDELSVVTSSPATCKGLRVSLTMRHEV